MQYNENDIDEFGLLKPGFGVYFAAVFFCRQLFYFPLIKVVSIKGRASSGANIDMSFVHINSSWELIACVPAVLALILLFLRKPSAGNIVRTLWKQLKNILLLGAVAQTAVIVYLIVVQQVDSIAYLMQALISVYLLYTIVSSERLAHIVREFPSQGAPGSS